MANLNRYTGIGRLTRDPEIRTLANGSTVAKVGLAFNNPKKNQQTGQWESNPVFIDAEGWDGQYGPKVASILRDYCKKGSQVYVEGPLQLEQWQDKQTGANRQKISLKIFGIQLLDPKQDGQGGGGQGGGQRRQYGQSHNSGDTNPNPGGSGQYIDDGGQGGGGGYNEDIPF